MQLGMIGLGRMGSDMTRRLLQKSHDCVVFDTHTDVVSTLQQAGAKPANSLQHFVEQLIQPRVIWLMLPTAVVEQELAELVPLLDAGDIIIDGGNSYYCDDIARGIELKKSGIHYLDVGTSGGIFGLQRGYCLMIGGELHIVEKLAPIFAALAPGGEGVAITEGRKNSPGTAEQGYLYCGAQGAGHFVKMIHNGIEYGMMAAYAEGLNILRNANAGKHSHDVDAETTPLRHPEYYQYEFALPDIVEVWRRGSVISSWLLDLTANALHEDPTLAHYGGIVSDSGEGRWTIKAAIDEAVPTPVLSAALYERFSSRGNSDFGNKVLSAMRHQFGGHNEKPEAKV